MRTRLVPAALAALLCLAACSSGGAKKTGLSSTPTPKAGVTSAPARGTSHTAAPRTSTAPATVTSPSAAATGSAASASLAPLTTKAPGKPAAQKATSPGTYTFDASGTVTFGNPGTAQDAAGTQTLTVSALVGSMQHSTMHGDHGDTEEDVLVRDTGSYAASLKLTSPVFTKEFRPSPAVLLVPDPAKPGAAWSWSGTSTDGKTRVQASNKILRTETVTIGGKKVVCAVLLTRLVLSGDVTYTADVTTWWSPDYRLPVKDHTIGNGTYNGIPFKTDIAAVMRSVTPS